MYEQFISDQQWIYVTGETIPEALRNLADILDLKAKEEISVSEGYRTVYYDYTKIIVEIIYDDDPADDKSYYRAGTCFSWKPGK